MKVLKVALVIIAALCVAANANATLALKQGSTVILKIGNHEFHVPEQYSREATIPLWLEFLPGLDDDGSDALLMIPAEEVSQDIEGYAARDNTIREDISIRISDLGDHGAAKYRHTAGFRDLWYAKGEYAERVVEPVKGEPWFRVYREPTMRYTWELLKQYPDPSKPIPPDLFDYWIGTCLESHSPLLSPGNLASCDTSAIVGDLLIEFSVSQQNLHLIDRVKAYVVRRILAWRIK